MNTKMITGISLAAVFALSAGLLSVNFAQEAQAGILAFPIVETVRYDNIPIKAGELAVLVDTTDIGSMSVVHVAANLPCDEDDEPLVVIIAGDAGTATLFEVISSSAQFTGFTGISGTCVYHASIDTVTALVLTDVILANFSGDTVPLPKGTTITISGMVPFLGF